MFEAFLCRFRAFHDEAAFRVRGFSCVASGGLYDEGDFPGSVLPLTVELAPFFCCRKEILPPFERLCVYTRPSRTRLSPVATMVSSFERGDQPSSRMAFALDARRIWPS